MNRVSQQTYHLYHHQPEPLGSEDLCDHAWLVNNGASYRLVATIQARTPEEAYQAVRRKTTGQGKSSRFVTLHMGNMLRATEPGDVLVDEKAAWMIVSEAQLRPIAYQKDVPWKSYRHDGTVWCVRWSPDGNHVVVIENVVSIHTPERTDERYSVTSYRHHNYTGRAVEWSPDGKRIASAGYDGEVHIWKPEPLAGYASAAKGSIVICRPEKTHSSYTRVTALAWNSASTTLLAATADELVQWDAGTGEQLQTFKRHQDNVNTLLYSPDSSHLASASDDGTLRVWQIGEPPAHDRIFEHAGAVSSVAWSPDGTLLVSACANDDQSLQFWDLDAGKPSERLPLSVYSTRFLSILTLAWSSDGRYIATGCDDGTVQIVDVGLRKHVVTYRSEAMRHVQSVAWSPDGMYLAAGGENRWGSGGTVELWRMDGAREMIE